MSTPEQCRDYYQRNKDKLLARHRARYDAKREEILAAQRDKRRAASAARKALEAAAKPVEPPKPTKPQKPAPKPKSAKPEKAAFTPDERMNTAAKREDRENYRRTQAIIIGALKRRNKPHCPVCGAVRDNRVIVRVCTACGARIREMED